MGLSLKIDNRDEINSHLSMALEWFREHSDNFDSPRRISLAIIGLVSGDDPPKSHHIQRLVTKLRNIQNKTNNSKNRSWSEEILDTAFLDCKRRI